MAFYWSRIKKAIRGLSLLTNNHDVVRFENVSMRYDEGPDVLRNMSFALPAGSFHFLTGASGAGKSSLIKLMSLAYRNYQGNIKLFGRNMRDVNPNDFPNFRQHIGIVFQDFYLIDHLSVLENVALPLKIRGVSAKQSHIYASEILAWVGLSRYINDYPTVLSGGEKQRVAIARAVIGSPKMLLADEPTGSVDDKIAVKILNLFQQLHRMGTTIVLATHNHDLINEFAQPILHLQDQELILLQPNQQESVRDCA